MVNANLAYEILMYLNSFYFGMFALVEAGIIIFKTIQLRIYDGVYIFAAVLLLESFRIYLGRKGSLSKHGWQVIASVVLILPCIAGTTCLITLQCRTIRMEYILCALELILQFTELFYAILFMFSACRTRTYT